MWYEVNVSYKGKHFFATAPRSLTNAYKASLVWETLKGKFPKSEGYEVTCTSYETTGANVVSIVDGKTVKLEG